MITAICFGLPALFIALAVYDLYIQIKKIKP